MARLGIIGGYLGSGKTTLVNRLLAGILPGRTAVVVNDFGSVNIDAALIASATEDTIELTNGCICCQITDDFAQTMAPLAQRTDIDNVLCEVSGVGDPLQLGSWRSFPGFSAGPLLVCADATSLRKRLNDPYVGDVVENQIRSAEVVLLTKTDLTSTDVRDDAERACRMLAPSVQVIVPGHEDLDSALQAVFSASGAATAAAGGEETHSPAGSNHDHGTNHETKTIEDLPRCDVAQLRTVLEKHKGQLLRAKGFFQDMAGDWYQVQFSGHRVDTEPHPQPSASSRGQIVLIAAGPDAQEVFQAIESDLLIDNLSERGA